MIPVVEEPKPSTVTSPQLATIPIIEQPKPATAEVSPVRQPSSDMTSKEAKSSSEYSISIFSMSKRADVDE